MTAAIGREPACNPLRDRDGLRSEALK